MKGRSQVAIAEEIRASGIERVGALACGVIGGAIGGYVAGGLSGDLGSSLGELLYGVVESG